MNEPLRVVLSGISLAVYMGLMILKVLRGRKVLHPLERSVIHFDLIRLGTDFTVQECFLLTGLCPAWFGLFGEGDLGTCTACILLISITLLVSVFVDWIPVRMATREREKLSFGRFLLRQLANICGIELVLALIWGVFLILEPTETGVGIKLLLAITVLLLFSGLLRLIRKTRRRKEAREEE